MAKYRVFVYKTMMRTEVEIEANNSNEASLMVSALIENNKDMGERFHIFSKEWKNTDIKFINLPIEIIEGIPEISFEI